MGTKVHSDSYYNHTMRDLNEDFNGNNWRMCYTENGITNGQQYYNGFIDNTSTYANPNCERDALKQRMLEHEAIFKSQLHELHRLYKIQRELMEDVKKKELHRFQVSIEQQPSSSSSSLRGHLHGGFPLFNSGYARTSTSRVEIGNLPLSCTKEYNAGLAQFPYPNGSTSKEFEGLDSRPSKVRKTLFDLQLPAEKNIDAEEERVDLNQPVRIEVEAVASSIDAKGVNRPEKSSIHSDLVNGDGVLLRNGFSMNSGVENRVNGGLLPRIFDAGSSKGIVHQHGSLVYSDRSHAVQSSNGHLEHREASRTYGSYPFFTPSSYNNSWAHSASSSTQKRSMFDPSLNSIATIDRSQVPLAGNSLVNGSCSIAREPQACSPFSGFSYLNCNRNDNSRHNVERRTIDIDLNEVGEENKTTEDNVSALPWLKHKPPVNDCETTKTVKKILGIPIFGTVARTNETAASDKKNKKRVLDINLECDPDDDEPALEKEKNHSGFGSTRDVMIDLNSCIVETDDPSLPLGEVPPRANRILEIDLEAPPVQESEEETAAEPYREIAAYKNSSLLQSKVDKIEVIHDEDLKNAAETIFAISSFCPSVEEVKTLPSSENSLLWFADLVSSFANGEELTEKQLLSEEIDDFEAMTLQLQEMREDKDYMARPIGRELEETGPSNSSITRSRRGQSRRGRQRKDFQRDILPGLSTLSRQEVTEDLQTFGGLMRAMGHHWNLGPTRRNGGGARGRRRAVTEALSNDVQSRVFEVPLVHKLGTVLEERSITGWGKTTRRPRRQRCAASGNNNPMKAVLT